MSSDHFETRAPSLRNVVELFDGEWTSALPIDPSVDINTGRVKLFEDARIVWAEQEFGGFAGRRVLELGPLEGGHTYMLHQRGARDIVAVEANRRAFLKCLCVKELYELSRARFLLGDLVNYLHEQEPATFDMVIASGVLYHMMEPIRALDPISRAADRLFIWTHYYDAAAIAARADVARNFGARHSVEHDGRNYEVVDYHYDEKLLRPSFIGGTAVGSRWLPRETIVAFLRDAGFQTINFKFEQPDHIHGPAFALCASR